jgi:lysyl-tRNA synthetase class 2
VEWYRIGFSLGQLMDEVELLVTELVGTAACAERLSYREVFLRELSLDPFEATVPELAKAAAPLGLSAGPRARDEYLELLMGALIGPRLGAERLTFVHGYPASQAALARLDPADPRAAQRFELYARGIELANGFHELTSAAEQRGRFEADNAARRARRLPVHPPDERLLAALSSGLPDCAGVALGLDRLLMLATGASHIEEVLAFPTRRA